MHIAYFLGNQDNNSAAREVQETSNAVKLSTTRTIEAAWGHAYPLSSPSTVEDSTTVATMSASSTTYSTTMPANEQKSISVDSPLLASLASNVTTTLEPETTRRNADTNAVEVDTTQSPSTKENVGSYNTVTTMQPEVMKLNKME